MLIIGNTCTFKFVYNLNTYWLHERSFLTGICTSSKFFSCDTAFKETYILKLDLLSHVYGMFLLEQAKTECMVVTFQWKVYK